TLYQLVAACETTPTAVDSAASLATIPDLLNLNLTGILAGELTDAAITQCATAPERTWPVDLLSRLDLPVRLLPRLIEPGTVLGPLRSAASSTLAGNPLVVPACHDTGSSVGALPA